MSDTNLPNDEKRAFENSIGVDGTSYSPVYLETHDEKGIIETATGFLVETEHCIALVTNWHVVTGKKRNTNTFRDELRCFPKGIKVSSYSFSGPNQILHEATNWINIYKDDQCIEPNWFEHPEHGKLVDLVALPMSRKPETTDVKIIYQQISREIEWKQWFQGDRLLVVGYPYGLRTTIGAIWITGHIATDPATPLMVDGVGVPAFLVDARTRSGQSGSPVIGRFKKGDMVFHQGKQYELNAAYMDFFLGIYSGRINSDSDLGYVWRPSLVRETVAELEKSGPYWPSIDKQESEAELTET